MQETMLESQDHLLPMTDELALTAAVVKEFESSGHTVTFDIIHLWLTADAEKLNTLGLLSVRNVGEPVKDASRACRKKWELFISNYEFLEGTSYLDFAVTMERRIAARESGVLENEASEDAAAEAAIVEGEFANMLSESADVDAALGGFDLFSNSAVWNAEKTPEPRGQLRGRPVASSPAIQPLRRVLQMRSESASPRSPGRSSFEVKFTAFMHTLQDACTAFFS